MVYRHLSSWVVEGLKSGKKWADLCFGICPANKDPGHGPHFEGAKFVNSSKGFFLFNGAIGQKLI
jgi:hypothetical protein